MQARQDEEIDNLDANAFQESEALETQRERFNLKYMCVFVGQACPFVKVILSLNTPGAVFGSWDYFPSTNACPLAEKLGMTPGFGDSGKWVCGVETLLQKKPCVVYSFG